MNFLKSTRLNTVCLILIAALLGQGVYLYYRYKGFTTALFNYTFYSTVAENENLYFCLSYWFEFVGKLRLTPDNFLTFDGVPEEGLSDFEKGQLAYHRADFGQAIRYIEADTKANGESETKVFWLAMSYMRQAEFENCLSKLTAVSPVADTTHGALNVHQSHNLSQLCALPLTQFHDRDVNAKSAAKLFERLLDTYDTEDRLYRWLLNFNYMTVNGWPQEVPAKYRIQNAFTDAFYGERKKKIEAEFSLLVFEERARELGVDTYNTGRGVAVEDFDKDGDLDLVTGGSFDYLIYYRNDQGRAFTDDTRAVGLGNIKQPFFTVPVDYDNDGWMDLFVSRMFGRGYQLLKNNGNGGFVDVTKISGILEGMSPDMVTSTWTPAWADIDNDGDLDVFLAHLELSVPFSKGILANPRMSPRLMINESGRFYDRTAEFGLADDVTDQYYTGATFGDYDADGYPDLFVSSPVKKASSLFRNLSGKGFEKTDLFRRAEGGFAASFVDINHDGKLDIFWGAFADARTSTEMAVFGEGLDTYHSGHTTILLQKPDGKFDALDDLFDMPMGTMGSSFGDINNDGIYDFYLGTGTPEGWFVLPNLMYVGEADGTKWAPRVTNISMTNSFGTIQKGHGVSFFDFDEDGDQDIYASLGGMWPADRWPNQLFVNASAIENTWVKIRLQGKRTNSFGVGATIKVIAENPNGDEIVRYAAISQKTGFGSGPFLAHVGLMNATRVKTVEVYWPVSRVGQTYEANINQLNTLEEP